MQNSNNVKTRASNGQTDGHQANGCITANGSTNGIEKLKNSIDRDIIRIIGQQLREYGLDRTVDTLMQESGCKLDHPSAAKFQTHIMSGEWREAESDLQDLRTLISSSQALLEMKFLILEQKFLELLDDEQSKEGLLCLQTELTPLNHRINRIHELTMFVMARNRDEFRRLAGFDGKGTGSRRRLMEKLQEYLPPEVMLPPRRLLALLNQAAELQKERCPFHNDLTDNGLDNSSLLVDHVCSRDEFPCETRQILSNHYEEVCYCQFSNDGTKLASGSKDGCVMIWEVDPVSSANSHSHMLI